MTARQIISAPTAINLIRAINHDIVTKARRGLPIEITTLPLAKRAALVVDEDRLIIQTTTEGESDA